jgi:hypothetical protein
MSTCRAFIGRMDYLFIFVIAVVLRVSRNKLKVGQQIEWKV